MKLRRRENRGRIHMPVNKIPSYSLLYANNQRIIDINEDKTQGTVNNL
jgi:hypothetical protein